MVSVLFICMPKVMKCASQLLIFFFARFLIPPSDCVLYRLALASHRYRSSFSDFLPGYPLIITPWGSSVSDWQQFVEPNNPPEISAAESDLLVTTCTPISSRPWQTLSTTSLSNLTLYPAPGEEFNLDISVMDELLNVKDATLSVMVSGGLFCPSPVS